LRCKGEALLALGKPREALVPLERSVSLSRRVFAGDLARARFALALAPSCRPTATSRERVISRSRRGESSGPSTP
jgi:hypothetical protein